MQAQQSPFASLAAASSLTGASSAAVAAAASLGSPVSLATFPSAFAAFASQLRSTQLQSLLQSQVAALQSRSFQQQPIETKQRVEYPTRKRVGGSTVKTAKVWRFFDELPTPEQAAECRICRKKIKATNSSTTGMIRHLRSCHVQEYQLVQEARQSSMIVKMEEKARAKLLRDMNDKVSGNVVARKDQESQKSPSASSSASDTASSTTSSLFAPNLVLPPGLAAPKPIKPVVVPMHIKCETTEEEESDKPTNLSTKTSAFSSLVPSSADEKEGSDQRRRDEDQYKIHMQVALMLLLDQHPPQLVDRPGFRALIRFLLPDYHLPSANVFQSTICPQLLNQMRQQIGAIFSINNPIANPFDEQASPEAKGEQKVDISSFEDQNIEVIDEPSREEDCESASSVDTDASGTDAFIQFIGNAFPHEELSSLLSVVHSVFCYFEVRGQLVASLRLAPAATSSTPALLREVDFVASNLPLITEYIRDNTDMELLPLSVAQANLLALVVQRLRSLV